MTTEVMTQNNLDAMTDEEKRAKVESIIGGVRDASAARGKVEVATELLKFIDTENPTVEQIKDKLTDVVADQFIYMLTKLAN